MILLIAIHAALSIFKPGGTGKEAGLYYHRHIAYACWAIVSIAMASIAFVNPHGAYITQGTFCYLPVRPFWYRLALAWIPRYLIFGAILGSALAIYVYVGITFSVFEIRNSMAFSSMDSAVMVTEYTLPNERRSFQLSRLVAFRNLPQRSKATDLVNYSVNQTRQTVPNTTPIKERTHSSDGPSDVPAFARPAWEGYSFGRLTPLPNVAFDEELEPSRPHDTKYSRKSHSIIEALRDRRISPPDYFRSRSRVVERPSPTQPGTSRLNFSFKRPLHEPRNDAVLHNANLQRRRKNVHRSVRLLFVYPLVYLLTWTIPFVSHCFQYNDHYSKHPSFVLSSLVTAIVALQCAIDCWVFAAREKPWRTNRNGTFWDNFSNQANSLDVDQNVLSIVERGTETVPKLRHWWSVEEKIRNDSFRTTSVDTAMERRSYRARRGDPAMEKRSYRVRSHDSAMERRDYQERSHDSAMERRCFRAGSNDAATEKRSIRIESNDSAMERRNVGRVAWEMMAGKDLDETGEWMGGVAEESYLELSTALKPDDIAE